VLRRVTADLPYRRHAAGVNPAPSSVWNPAQPTQLETWTKHNAKLANQLIPAYEHC
jgi:hypothetical protein